MKKNNKMEKKIFQWLEENDSGYSDYDQKVEDVADEFDIDMEEAESYVWNWLNKNI